MASGMTVDGMISGLSTTSLVDGLINAEAASQRALKTRLSNITKSAALYRSINTTFDTMAKAAEKLTAPGGFTPTAATSTSPVSVSASMLPGAATGSLTFSVVSVAASHSVVSAGSWTAPTDPSGFGGSLEIFNADATSRGTVTIGGTGSLADTVAAINKSDLGIVAAAVQVSPGQYRLQVTSKDPGAEKAFSVGNPGDFAVATQGVNAHLKVGNGPGAYDVYSNSNEFKDLMPGATIKVTKPEADVTVSIAQDPAKLTELMQGFVDAANAALTEIKKSTAASKDSAALLSGDSSLRRLSNQVLSAVTAAVGGDGSAGAFGVELTRDGMIKFDKDKFATTVAADPARAERVLTGTAAQNGTDGVKGTADDIAAVPGVAQRLQDLAKQVTDKTTGSLTLLAQGRDKLADDVQDRIDSWDLRLESRRANLMRQFSAMEVALGSMKSQSSWLSAQLSSLPTY